MRAIKLIADLYKISLFLREYVRYSRHSVVIAEVLLIFLVFKWESMRGNHTKGLL